MNRKWARLIVFSMLREIHTHIHFSYIMLRLQGCSHIFDREKAQTGIFHPCIGIIESRNYTIRWRPVFIDTRWRTMLKTCFVYYFHPANAPNRWHHLQSLKQQQCNFEIPICLDSLFLVKDQQMIEIRAKITTFGSEIEFLPN